MEAGDVLIMGGDLRRVADGMAIARRTFRVIKQNLAWAFGYNILMIPLALVGKVSPLVAAGVMAGSSLTVVGNALRLRRFGERPQAASRPAEVPVPDLAPSPAVTLPDRSNQTIGDLAPAGVPHRAEVSSSEGRPTRFAREEAKRIGRALDRLFVNQWEI
jgi:hypothetical protein